MKDENIQIKSYVEQDEIHKIYPKKEIKGDFIDFNYEKNLTISNITDKDGYTVIIFYELTKEDKNINLKNLIVRIIKWLPDNKILKKKLEIKVNKTISEDFKYGFFYFDIFKINEKMSFLFIYLFNNIYFYKIYENENNSDNMLFYEELHIKEIENMDKNNIYMYLGNTIYNDKKLEFVFLEKTKNYFLYFIFDLSAIDVDSNEVDCNIINRTLDKDILENNKLRKFWRGNNCDKFIFLENKKFKLILKDNNNDSKMQLYPFDINYNNRMILPEKIPMICKILDKMYIIIDITKLEEFSNLKNKVILGIFEIYFDEENKIFTTKILQEIYFNVKIKANNGKYNLNLISNKKVLIGDDSKLYFIIFNNNCIAESIYPFEKYYPSNNLINYYLNNESTNFRVYMINPKENKIFCTKISTIEVNSTNSNSILNSNIFENKNFLKFDITEKIPDINKLISENLKKIIEQNCDILEKEYNKIKEKNKNDLIETDKSDKRLEKLSVMAVETIEDIPENDKLFPNKNSFYKDRKPYYKNNYKNEQKIGNKWQNENKINYKYMNNYYKNQYYNNKINQNEQMNYKMNNNNQMNKINDFNNSYNINQMNNINMIEYLKKLNTLKQMNQLNQMNNFQNNQNNINLIQNQMNNTFNPNHQLYNNINSNFFPY